MNKDAWEELLHRLPQPKAEDALFGIFEDGEQSERGFIRANKEGIQLVANELLLCLRSFDREDFAEEPKRLPVRYPEVFKSGGVIPEHLELLPFKRGDQPVRPVAETAGDTGASIAGCLLLLAFLLLCLVVGAVTILGWLFG